jgi:hypothetical protein
VIKNPKLHLKVLMLLTVYLFFSITNAFFVSRQTHTPRRSTLIKPAAQGVFHIPKASRVAIYQTRVSMSQLAQSAAQFFIVLFFCIGLLKADFKSGWLSFFYRPDLHYSYLRHCVIRI